MNFLDILIVIPAIWAGFRGFKNGLVKEIFSILAFVGGLYLSYKFAHSLAEKIDSSSAYLIAFALIFTATIVLTFIVGHYVDKIVKVVVPDFIDRLCGICFGVLKILMICSGILYFVQQADNKEVILSSEVLQESVLYGYVAKTTAFIESAKEDNKNGSRFEETAEEDISEEEIPE